MRVVPKRSMRHRGVAEAISPALEGLGGRAVYLSIDADVGAGEQVGAVRFLDTIGLSGGELESVFGVLAAWLAGLGLHARRDGPYGDRRPPGRHTGLDRQDGCEFRGAAQEVDRRFLARTGTSIMEQGKGRGRRAWRGPAGVSSSTTSRERFAPGVGGAFLQRRVRPPRLAARGQGLETVTTAGTWVVESRSEEAFYLRPRAGPGKAPFPCAEEWAARLSSNSAFSRAAKRRRLPSRRSPRLSSRRAAYSAGTKEQQERRFLPERMAVLDPFGYRSPEAARWITLYPLFLPRAIKGMLANTATPITSDRGCLRERVVRRARRHRSRRLHRRGFHRGQAGALAGVGAHRPQS